MIEAAYQKTTFPPEDLEGIIVGTISHDRRATFPSMANRVQQRLGASKVKYANDVVAACSGFTHALDHAWLRVEKYGGYVLVIGVDALTRITDYTELNGNLFGDGCGLVILGHGEDRGIIATEFASDAAGADYIFQDKEGYLRMPKGPLVFSRASKGMIDIANALLEKAAITPDALNKIIPHQANGNIIDRVEEKIDPQHTGKIYRNLDRYGNMSAATIPTALAEAIERGEIRKNDLVMLLDFGSGLTMGGAIIKI